MRDNTMVARRIADKRSAAFAAARYLTEKFGLSEDQVEDLIQQYGLGRDKLDTAARRLAD